MSVGIVSPETYNWVKRENKEFNAMVEIILIMSSIMQNEYCKYHVDTQL